MEFPPEARVDTWVEVGTEISPWYDPLLAKILVTGADRPAAVAALGRALGDTCMAGITTNLGLLAEAVASPAFAPAPTPPASSSR